MVSGLDTNLRTAILKNVKDGILWFTADNTQKEIDDADKGFEPKYRAVFENPEGDAVKAFEADHCYPLQFYTASVGAKDNQLYKKAGLSNEKVSGIDKKTWDKWIEVLTGKNKAVSASS